MNRSAKALPLALILACSSTAFAQSSEYAAIQPAESAAVTAKKATSGSCTGGHHYGIDPADAQRKSEHVCEELRGQSLLMSHSFLVEIRIGQLVGSLSIYELGQRGAAIRNWEVPLENAQGVYTETQSLVRMVVEDLGETPRERATHTVTEKYWYGWETLTADAISAAFLFGGGKDSVGASAGTFCLGAPLVHAFNGNPGRASISLGMRALTIGFVASIANGGSAKDSDGERMGQALGALVIAGLLVPVVVALDASLLAREERQVEKYAIQWNLTPTVGKNSGGLSVGGIF